MIYYFTYQIDKRHYTKTCYTLREAEIFFDILLSAHVEYVRVITMTRRHYNDKI